MSESLLLEHFRLTGRSILVTGATGHLGRPIAHAVVEAGGIPILAGRSPERLAALAKEIRGPSQSVAFDVGSADQCRKAVAEVARRVGSLDGIVNCAYNARAATIDTTS